MNKVIKIIYIFIIASLLLISFNNVYAVDCQICGGKGYYEGTQIVCQTCKGTGKVAKTKTTTNGGDINPDGFAPTLDDKDLSAVTNKTQGIITIISTIGIIVSVATIILIGIKFMLGSAEQKADYKARMVPLIVGMLFLFGTSTIMLIVYNIVKSLNF